MKKRFPVPYSDPRWWWDPQFGVLSACFDCADFMGRIEGKICCRAFPDGIPKELFLSEKVIHIQPYPGDHGIQFKAYQDDLQEGALNN